MWVLMIVTYPGCNRGGEGCREIIDFFHSFEAMVEFTDHWMARIIMKIVAVKTITPHPDGTIPGTTRRSMQHD